MIRKLVLSSFWRLFQFPSEKFGHLSQKLKENREFPHNLHNLCKIKHLFLTTNIPITFDLRKLRIWCNTLFCSVWRALSRGTSLFWFWRPPKNHQFSGLAILPENAKKRKLRKNCRFSSLVTFKFGFSTLKLTKINCKSLVTGILKKSETFWCHWPWPNTIS